MEFGEKSNSKRKRAVEAVDGGVGLVKCSRSIRRKRVAILEGNPRSAFLRSPFRKPKQVIIASTNSPLEFLPQDVLVKIFCRVEHEDLKQLFHVSKSFRDATLIARKNHFAFSTPLKRIAFSHFDDVEDQNMLSNVAPNAPIQNRIYQFPVCRKKLADISIALFRSPEKEKSRKG
ncbi:hypothetical protein GIB67_025167 [Kingdonia uniflora]|uniref:F-box domain-containing protein n=1 Tax=Kingdonia uniflora TaxID=39325 RepID=A0A7J7N883_9MAGN|nr:hypothetical protein GIB67_025167 [Kingdonia uniflora]